MRNASPLRYPGGKWRLAAFFQQLITLNFRRPPIYMEPYAGGASLALNLLYADKVEEIFLNDLDPAIYAFWHSVLNRTKSLIHLIERTNVTPAEWRRQKKVYAAGIAAGKLSLGFATFFLNRTNHSGILNAGMIGGNAQSGDWKLDARYNREELIARIATIASERRRIHFCNADAADFVRSNARLKNTLTYFDPPYYRPAHLYLNTYMPDDHARMRDFVLRLRSQWIVSYDDVSQIRKLYKNLPYRRVQLLHTARAARQGKEVIFFSPDLKVPTPKH
jgi:DNA adenine methylase